MNRIGKLARRRVSGNETTGFPSSRGRNSSRAASWGGVLGLTVLLVGGAGAFLMSASGPETATTANLEAVSAPANSGQASVGQSVRADAAQAAPSTQAGSAATQVSQAASGTAASAGWVAASEEVPAFRLEPLPQLAGTVALRGLMAKSGVVEGVQHASGGGRDDALMIGDADEAGPLLRLSLYRPGTEPQPGGSFFVDVARRASEAGMWVERFVAMPPLESRVGVVEIALARFDGHAGARNCVTFRQARPQPNLRLSGWICLDGANVPAPEAAACIIDAVRWQREAGEPGMAELFNGSGRTMNTSCAQPSSGDLTSSIRPTDDIGARR